LYRARHHQWRHEPGSVSANPGLAGALAKPSPLSKRTMCTRSGNEEEQDRGFSVQLVPKRAR
jgi:hypothetical protein